MEDATLAPDYDIQINGKSIDVGVRQLIQRVEYESTDGLADVAKVMAINPDNALGNAKTFQPGNEMSIFMGYGGELKHVGRVFLVKQRPQFPTDGMPILNVVGYTKDHKMMDNAPEKSAKVAGKGGRPYKQALHSDAVIDRAYDYGMVAEVDPTSITADFVQKVGMKDYEFVQGLANLTGFIFWVDGDEKGVWTLHFRDPDKTKTSDFQERELTFKYNQGDLSGLLSFQPEMLIKGFETKIKVQAKDYKSGKMMETEVEETGQKSPDIQDTGDPSETLDEPYSTASDMKLYVGDYSFDIISNKKFKTDAEVLAWAKQWFRRQREQFIMAKGTTIGVEDLMARQIHNFEGLGTGYDGKYYFTKVRHICSASDGYICEFDVRKVVPPVE